jgi:L-ascorbate metabolism protein UlaG (beta-lactamase superfamily)
MVRLTYHGHSAFELKSDKHNIIIDPFINYNKHAKVKPADIKVDYIILTHGHGDHFGDALEIAKNNDATIIAINELADYCNAKEYKAHAMHIGGGHNFPFGRVKYTIAHHSSSTPDGVYAGNPGGVIISTGGKNIYHAGDTGLFLDMKLIGEMTSLDVAMLPIGDNFTMGIDDAVKAVEFLNPKMAIPMHFSTFDIINADPNEFKRKVESIGKKGVVIPFGESIEI